MRDGAATVIAFDDAEVRVEADHATGRVVLCCDDGGERACVELPPYKARALIVALTEAVGRVED